MSHPLLLWASDNPWLAFFLAWPALFLLIGVCWSVAGLINNGINQCATLVVALLNAVVILFRGHAPVQPKWIREATELSSTSTPTDTRDDSPSSSV